MEIKPHADYSPIFRECWDRVRTLSGDVAEFGVFNGGSTQQLAEITGQTVWAFDTYSGIPTEDFQDGDRDRPGSFVCAYTFAQMFTSHHRIIPVRGRFSETLKMLPFRPMLRLVYIDCDLYQSAKQVFDWLPDHLVAGANIVIDDYLTHPGIVRAVDEFVKQWSTDCHFDNQRVIVWKPGVERDA